MRSNAVLVPRRVVSQRPIGEEIATARNRVVWLIDNGEAYQALVEGIRSARRSIWISQLAFDADCRVYKTGRPSVEEYGGGEPLLETILATCERKGVCVKILLNSTLLLDTVSPLRRFLDQRGIERGNVEVRGISRFPQLLHAKFVLIDERLAFVIGSPFVNGYWDDRSHPPVDNRRPHRELGGRPVHDVSLGLRGPAVDDIAGIFSRLWSGASDAKDDGLCLRPGSTIGGSLGAAGIETVTTEPRGSRGHGDPGSLQTVEALLDGINRARSTIYVEHQYLSSRAVAHALRTALDRERQLEIILLLNQNPDVTAYRRWQNARLAETGLLGHPRVGVFALWTTATGNGSNPIINQVFVHSKVVIIDDQWGMVGSANLDGVSLDSYGDDFSGTLARRVFRNVRNFDVSLVMHAEREADRVANPVRELRERLWAEHLGQRSAQATEIIKSLRLADWKARASQNVAALDARAERGTTLLDGTFILPYSTSPSPRAQLADLGVRPSTPIDLQFDPGWLEVNFSPNWVRNMFL